MLIVDYLSKQTPIGTYSQILSTRLFGKEINRKSKSVTIIHSATTETVRLPDDSNGVTIGSTVIFKFNLFSNFVLSIISN